MPPSPQPSNAVLKPGALLPGDTVAVVAPASQIKNDLLLSGCAALERAGYKVVYSRGILDHDLYFAGTQRRRIEELHGAFRDPAVKAILCARGGYGTNYLLPHLDLELLRRHPKIFCGYSDITTLLTYIHDQTGMVVFHGPMVTKDFAHDSGVDANLFKSAISAVGGWTIAQDPPLQPLRSGRARGKLYGGCLSMLAASLGTAYEIQTEGTVLFIEDIATKPYQIDRMLMQLKYAGKLDQVKGMIFGEMVDCIQERDQGYTLQEVIMRVLADFDFPVCYGLRSGHVSSGNITLPLGIQTQLTVSGSDVVLEICEGATTRSAGVQAVTS